MNTAHNAAIIEDQLAEAAHHLSAAIENYKNAIAAIESAETNASFKTPQLESLKGLAEVGHRANAGVFKEWSDAVESRRHSESQRPRSL